MELPPCKGEAGFRNPLNFCSWSLESWTLESGIQFEGSGIPLTIGVGNPSSTGKEFGIEYLESRIQGEEPRIQETVFDSLTSGERNGSDNTISMGTF